MHVVGTIFSVHFVALQDYSDNGMIAIHRANAANLGKVACPSVLTAVVTSCSMDRVIMA